ncbi:MAG: hypothetical protein IPK82_21435 [Polyangiaceae bacterium]|nr:hypothetical protein [Polyangiaceae bacterium]
MKAPICFVALLVGLTGCSGIFPSPVTPDTGKTADGPRTNFLPIADIEWRRGDTQAAALTSSGEVRDKGVSIGKLSADGTFVSARSKRSLVMDSTGTVHVAPGFDVIIDENGTAVSRVHGQPDETVTLEQIQKPRDGLPGLIPHNVTPETRRTAMWILMIPDLLRLLAGVEAGGAAW